MATPAAPSPEKKKFPWLPVAGGCCVLMIAAAVLFAIIGSKVADELVNSPSVIATTFFTTLKIDVPTAYSMTDAEFQEVTTQEDLAAYVADSPILTTWTELDFTSVTTEGNLTTLIGTMETATEYTPIYVEETPDANGTLRVNYFEIGYDPSAE